MFEQHYLKGFQFATRGVNNQREEVREIKGVMKTRGKRPKEEESSEIEDVEDILEEDKDDDEEKDMRWASVRPKKRKLYFTKKCFSIKLLMIFFAPRKFWRLT